MKKEEEKKFKEVGEAYRYNAHTLYIKKGGGGGLQILCGIRILRKSLGGGATDNIAEWFKWN